MTFSEKTGLLVFSLKQVSEAEWKLPKHVLLVPKRSAHDDTTQYCIGNSVGTVHVSGVRTESRVFD